MSQDLGLGRIVGQTLVYLYLSKGACSLDEIGDDLQLSKASISIAARQLERLGMIIRVWRSGDRKSYYRTAENFFEALQKGLIEFLRQKLSVVGSEIESAREMLEQLQHKDDPETAFVLRRIQRAESLKTKVETIIDSPVFHLLADGSNVSRSHNRDR